MDIVEALESRGIQYRRSGKPDELWLNCPFCVEQGESPDTRFRLGINIQDGRASCFNCKWKTGGLEFLVQELNRALQTGLFDLAESGFSPAPVKVELPEDFAVLQPESKKRDLWNNRAYRYVHSRHVTDEQIEKKQIGYSVVGPLKYRVIIPIMAGRLLKGLVGRDFTGKQQPKYKNSIGQKVLFNVPKRKSRTAVLVEGVFDALAVERGGLVDVDALAVLGTALTQLQLAQLDGYKKIILWADSDAAGITGFMRMVPELQRITKHVYLVLPGMNGGGKEPDPDERSLKDLVNKLQSAKPYTQELEQRVRAWLAFREED